MSYASTYVVDVGRIWEGKGASSLSPCFVLFASLPALSQDRKNWSELRGQKLADWATLQSFRSSCLKDKQARRALFCPRQGLAPRASQVPSSTWLAGLGLRIWFLQPGHLSNRKMEVGGFPWDLTPRQHLTQFFGVLVVFPENPQNGYLPVIKW